MAWCLLATEHGCWTTVWLMTISETAVAWQQRYVEEHGIDATMLRVSYAGMITGAMAGGLMYKNHGRQIVYIGQGLLAWLSMLTSVALRASV